MKCIKIEKEKGILSVFAHDIVLHTENPKDSIKKVLE